MTTDELAKRYKELHKLKTGQYLSDEQALEQAIKFVSLVKEVYQPISHKKDE